MLRSFGDYRAFLNNKIVLLIVTKLLAHGRKTRNMQRDVSVNINIEKSYDYRIYCVLYISDKVTGVLKMCHSSDIWEQL
jgi:hypothetical protein